MPFVPWVHFGSAVKPVADHIQLAPEVEIYPDGTIAIQFLLLNSSGETYYYGVRTALIKHIDENWYIVPFQGWVSFIDVSHTLAAGSSASVIFDIETLYGTLCEGNYALVMGVARDNQQYYVLGQFSICTQKYEIDVSYTNIAPRPLLTTTDIVEYSTDTGRGNRTILITHGENFIIWRYLQENSS